MVAPTYGSNGVRDVLDGGAEASAFGTPFGHQLVHFPPHGEPHQAEVEAAGVRIGFSSARVGGELLGIPTKPGENREVVLWCNDVDDLHRTALAAGGAHVTRSTNSPDGRPRYAWPRDLERHRVKLVQERGCLRCAEQGRSGDLLHTVRRGTLRDGRRALAVT